MWNVNFNGKGKTCDTIEPLDNSNEVTEMNYSHTVKARFLDRPNRFVAHVELGGQTETVHVKNTGRCRELLVPGYEVILEEGQNPARKTRYDLISVCKEGRWINMDSQAPNKVAEEWLLKGGFFPEDISVYRERKYGNSRFDLYIESPVRKAFMEVKGGNVRSG